MNVILEFCAGCGMLVPEPPTCPNCNLNVQDKQFRCTGTFSQEDAEHLMGVFGYELKLP